MGDNYAMEQEEIFSKVMRAGRRTYFFDVRATKAGDYYLTITESKKFTNDDGSFHYKKHKIYLYKEDFHEFKDSLEEMINYVLKEKGEEVISERHQKDYKREENPAPGAPDSAASAGATLDEPSTSNFTDIDFDDI
ncbi:DNA-binding protein [Patiriisocius marinistellae]|uniref:DNA-binding protein n=1 Tax=Patiriisocius marinistellae TaxID=2494560 RepID=A0A5J4G2E1_9FLAO|nr:PUR family DNA/RNA-binding protein [Patiriisocius marinistellae]GEQ86745.1 DNA-binding protein [Patiriisocius marinistellae]